MNESWQGEEGFRHLTKVLLPMTVMRKKSPKTRGVVFVVTLVLGVSVAIVCHEKDALFQNRFWIKGNVIERLRVPKGTLRRKEELETRIRPDPKDGRKKVYLHVCGDSMLPELKTGDRIVVFVDSDFQDAKKGQLITYIADIGKRGECYYTHKVVEVENNPLTGRRELVVRGVNNSACDSQHVTRAKFIGISRKM